MADAFRPQQNSIIQVHVRRRSVSEGLASMKDEGDIQAEIFDTLRKVGQRNDIFYQGSQSVLMADQIETSFAVSAASKNEPIYTYLR